MKLDIHVFVA